MKIVYVVDSITNFYQKVDLIRNRFGNNIYYVVKASLMPIFSSYGMVANAIYSTDSSKVIHQMLIRCNDIEDVVVCYASLNFDNDLLNSFITAIGEKQKIVSLMPKYNSFENIFHLTYNSYVKTIFKIKDSMVSPKLQFLPQAFVEELLNSHFGNRLFEVNDNFRKEINIEDKKLNKSAKIHLNFNKNFIIPIIVALTILALFFIGLSYIESVFFVIVGFIALILLDVTLTFIFIFKQYFDKRFLK